MIPAPGRKLLASTARVTLLIVSLTATLAVVEAAFRLLGVAAEYHQPFQERLLLRADLQNTKAPFGFVPYSLLLLTYDSNPREYFDSENSVEHVFNSVGWRDTEHSLEKPKNTFRVLGLGDSYLFGQGVHARDICLTRLGLLLEDQLGGRSVEAINTGRRALNTVDQHEILVERGLAYDPDLVIVHFVLNDVENADSILSDGPKVDFTDQYQRSFLTTDALSRYSRFWGWSRQRWLRWRQGDRYIQDCLASFSEGSEKWRDCRAALSDIKAVCRARRLPLLVVVFPFFHQLDGDYPFQEIHQLVERHCRDEGIDCLDLRDCYRSFHGPELWVHATDQHPNEVAHQIAAEAIAAYLRDHPKTAWRVAYRRLRDRPAASDQE